jgi:hypothetical protein
VITNFLLPSEKTIAQNVLVDQATVIISRGSAMGDQEIIFVVEESPEGGYEARALGYSIFTEGESLEELRTMVRGAVACHFDEPSKPSLIRLHLV